MSVGAPARDLDERPRGRRLLDLARQREARRGECEVRRRDLAAVERERLRDARLDLRLERRERRRERRGVPCDERALKQ